MSTPRKHHYVPKSFLAAWTGTGAVDGQLQVLDKRSGRTWTTSPLNVAVERDLYLLDLREVGPEVDALQIETTFGLVEAQAMPIIKALIAGGSSPTGIAREELITFVAVLIMRSPSMLRAAEEHMRASIDAAYRDLRNAGGIPKSTDPAIDELIEKWYDEGKIQIHVKRNATLGTVISDLPMVIRQLLRREWVVVRCMSDAGELVCTDKPATCVHTRAEDIGDTPAIEAADTVVFLPLAPNTALMGVWPYMRPPKGLERQDTEAWNGELVGMADRHIISRGDFAARSRSGETHSREQIAAWYAERASKATESP